MAYLDATDATFQTDVLERSMDVPVVVDLWAPWCGPCRTLGPIIERVIDATDGQVALVKVNGDENPGITQAFQQVVGQQGIPLVIAFKEGRPVDAFLGGDPRGRGAELRRPACCRRRRRARSPRCSPPATS